MIEQNALKARQARRRLSEALARAALSARNDAAQAVATPYVDENIPPDNVQTIADDPRFGMRTEQNYLSAFRNLDLIARGANIPQVLLDLPPSTIRMGDVSNDRKGSLPGRVLRAVPAVTNIGRDASDVPPEFALPSTSQRPLEFSMPQPPAVRPNFPRRQLRPGEMEEIVARLMPRVDPATVALAAAEFTPPPDPRDNWGGKIDAVVRGAAGVASLGGIDEGAAGADAFLHPIFNTGNPGETYSNRYAKNLDAQRAIDQSDYENRYGYRQAGQIGGGILAAILLSRGGIGFAPRALEKMAAQRALTVKSAAKNYQNLLLASSADSIGLGALNDFGNGKDGLWNRAGQVLKGVLPNAAAGVAAPVVAQVVTEAAKPVMRSVAEHVKSQFSEQIKRQTENMIVNALGVRGRARVRELVSIRNALDYKPRSQPMQKLTSQQRQQLRLREFDHMLKNGGIAQGFISPFLPKDQGCPESNGKLETRRWRRR